MSKEIEPVGPVTMETVIKCLSCGHPHQRIGHPVKLVDGDLLCEDCRLTLGATIMILEVNQNASNEVWNEFWDDLSDGSRGRRS